MLKGTIIENSLTDKDLLKKVRITKTWQSDDWILHSVEVPADLVQELSKHIDDGPWYIHFWQDGTDDITVVFKDKLFTVSRSDKSTWKDAVAYGISTGIPERELDFVIE